MTDEWTYAELLEPIAGDQPCGENLEDSLLLASFDAYRIFGQMVPSEKPPEWREIKRKSAEALQKSHDYRLLTHLAAASLWVDGPRAFLGVLNVAAHWLDNHWAFVYPLVDDDAILRKNALNCFADRIAVIDGVRRMPLLRHSQLGVFCLKDIEIITGARVAAEGETEERDRTQLEAAFAATPLAEVQALHQAVSQGVAALSRIEEKMRSEGGVTAAPAFDALVTQLRQIDRVFAEHLANHPESTGAVSTSPGAEATNDSASTAPAARTGGGLLSIQSRQDAIRALDAVAAYFRQHEPSSPIPMLIERGKRLVGKDFFEILAEVAPDGVGQAKAAGGIRDE